MPELNHAPQWQYHTVSNRIKACRLAEADLPRLFDIINEKQIEIANEIDPLIVKQESETDQQFQARQTNIRNAFVTLVSIRSPDGSAIHGSSRDIFSSPSVPERIASVLFSTSNALKAVGISPPSQANLYLDFGRPPFVNIGVMPSAPTPNESNYTIEGRSEPWVLALDARLRQFFEGRSTMRGWIHRQGMYDLLLISIGLVASIWVSARVSPLFYQSNTPGVLVNGIYVYCFFAALYLFRMTFDYTRWVFPLVEIEGRLNDKTAGHRSFWWLLMSGIGVAASWDLIRHFLFG